MQRADLMSRCWISVGLGLCFFGCAGSDPPAIVDEDTLSWQLESTGQVYRVHTPTNKDSDIKVACDITGDSIEFKVDEGELAEQMRPRSILKVGKADPKAGTCFVTVTEAPVFGGPAYVLTDSCKGTDPEGGCVLTGAFNSDGWDFNGTLTCSKLMRQPGDQTTQLYGSVVKREPVVIKLDNCN